MGDLMRMWFDGGPMMFAILLAFLGALATLLVQMVLRKGPDGSGSFVGWATTILALSLVAMAFGCLLTLDVAARTSPIQLDESSISQEDRKTAALGMRGLLLKGSAVAMIPAVFGLGFVIVLRILQFALDARSAPTSSSRGGRIIGGCGILALLVAGFACFRGLLVVYNVGAANALLSSDVMSAAGFWLNFAVYSGLVAGMVGFATAALTFMATLRASRAAA